MDSGSSESLQSSSGGDKEYDSVSAFINPSAAHFGSISTPQPPQLCCSNTTMFDHLPTYFDDHHMPKPPQTLQNPSSWPKTIRSDTTNEIIISPRASAPSSNQAAHGGHNAKKRSRTSRRAPTTVLTTDTTNFRAMVQEFTGIPAPPFTSPPLSRSRIDLFGTPSTVRSNLLGPSFRSSSSSSMINASSELGHPKQPAVQSLNLSNRQNPILTSLLQSNPPPKIIGLNNQELENIHSNHANLLFSSDCYQSIENAEVPSVQSQVRSINGDYDFSTNVMSYN